MTLWDAASERAARGICSQAGLDLVFVTDVGGVEGSGRIGWARGDLRPWAELYGALTGRQALSGPPEDGAEADMLAVDPRDITPEWLGELNPLQPLGLLVFDPDRDPLLTVLGAKIARCRRHSVSATFLDPGRGRSLRWSSAPTGLEYGGGTSSAALPALESERGVLIVSTHSDGVDALLAHDELTLCPRAGWSGSDEEPSDRLPVCVRLGHCHRHELPLDAPGLDALTIDPSRLNAFVVVLAACHGLHMSPPEAGSLSWPGYRWSLMAALLRGRASDLTALGAGLHFDAADGYRALVAELEDGVGVGRAIAEENRRNPHGRLVLVGDPAVAFEKRRQAPGRRSIRAQSHRSGPGPCSGPGMRFLAAYLVEAAVGSVTEEQTELSGTAHSLAATLQSQVDLARWDSATGDLLHARLFTALTEFLATRGVMIALDWSRLGVVQNVFDGEEPCSWCGAICRRWLCRFRNPGLGRRYLVSCWRCGIVRDSWTRGRRRVESTPFGWKAHPRGGGPTSLGQAAVAQRAWGASKKTVIRPTPSGDGPYALIAAPDEAEPGAPGLLDDRAQGIFLEQGRLEILALPPRIRPGTCPGPAETRPSPR